MLKTFSFTFEDLYKISDNKTKEKANEYIEDWMELGILVGMFGLIAKSFYRKARVKNSELLELLIYGIYVEKQSKIEKQEQEILYEDANYYYQERTKRSK